VLLRSQEEVLKLIIPVEKDGSRSKCEMYDLLYEEVNH